MVDYERTPTIRDIARQANVSVATVSRIVNGRSGYGAATRDRVLEVIERLGYTPNAIAKGLVQKRTHTIGVLLPSVTSQFASELLGGIETRAHRENFSAIVCNTDRDGRRTAEYLRVLAEKQVDGIVFTSEVLTDEYERMIERMRVPVVLVSTMSNRYQIPYVRVDDEKAAYAATEYLIMRGHVRIGMVAGTESDPIAGQLRIDGYRAALRAHGIEPRDETIVHGDFHFARGKEAAGELLDNAPNLTAIFAASDEMALGVLSAAWERGLTVPDDLSVVGYDDTTAAHMAIPPLTALSQPIRRMGESAVEMLIERRNDSVVLPFSISERASVRDLRGGAGIGRADDPTDRGGST